MHKITNEQLVNRLTQLATRLELGIGTVIVNDIRDILDAAQRLSEVRSDD